MLLVIDVGNTNITLGVFNGENLSATFRMTTKIQRTSDEYGIALNELIWHQGFEKSDIDACIVASVVPDIMHSLGSAMIKYFGIKPIVVSAGIKTGLKIKTENPKQVGADRIVDAVAAYTLHGGPVIVIDYGTATTYDVVGADGTFEAAVIAPGIRTSAQAMWNQAAMLPAVEIKKVSHFACSSATRGVMAAICSDGVIWVTISSLLFFSNVWSYSEPTRTIKNSSILLPKMAANLMRSARGTLFSLARASTRLSKSSQLSSRLIKMLSDGFSKTGSSLPMLRGVERG